MKGNDPKSSGCQEAQRGLRDVMEILSGKWKIPIMLSLSYRQITFMELKRELEGITAKMLSNALKDLEANGLVDRRVINSKPVTVEYQMSEYGSTLQPVLFELTKWGINHRKHIFGRETTADELAKCNARNPENLKEPAATTHP